MTFILLLAVDDVQKAIIYLLGIIILRILMFEVKPLITGVKKAAPECFEEFLLCHTFATAGNAGERLIYHSELQDTFF